MLHKYFVEEFVSCFVYQVRPPLKNFCKDLRAGTTIICDRYAFSGVAYSVAKGAVSGDRRKLPGRRIGNMFRFMCQPRSKDLS